MVRNEYQEILQSQLVYCRIDQMGSWLLNSDLSKHRMGERSDILLCFNDVTLSSVWAYRRRQYIAEGGSLMLNGLEVVCIDFCLDSLFCLVLHLLIPGSDYTRIGLMELILLTVLFFTALYQTSYISLSHWPNAYIFTSASVPDV